METKTVVVAGATGNLGQLIVEELLRKPGTRVRALVRSSANAGALRSQGVEVVEASLSEDDGQNLAKAVAGAHSVVSAVQGGPEVIVGGQSALLKAAAAAGVRRFLPSDFSFNFFGLNDGENINSDWRRSFARQAQQIRGNTQVVHVMNGCFLDTGVLFGFLGAIDVAGGKAFLWGDGNAKMDFTTYSDTAKFTAEAATDDRDIPDLFQLAGDTLDFHQLVNAYEQGSTRRLTVERMGSLADLDREIETRRKEQPQNVFAWLPLMYWRGMLNGKGKLGELMNSRYPHIQPETVTQYVRRHGL